MTKDPFVVYCSGIDARSSNINITSRSDVKHSGGSEPHHPADPIAANPPTTTLPLAHNGQLDKLTTPGSTAPASPCNPGQSLTAPTRPSIWVNFAGLTKIEMDALGGVDVYSTKTFSMGG